MTLTKTVFVLSRLRYAQTDHSALENYTVSFVQDFLEDGLSVYLLQPVAMDRCGMFRTRFLSNAVNLIARSKILSTLVSFVYTLYLSIAYLGKRSETTVFVNNAARADIPLLFILKLFGYKIVFWITDYYPSRRSFIYAHIMRFATRVIVINKYIAEDMPSHIPCEIFYGGISAPPPKELNLIPPGMPAHLVYAGKLNELNAIDRLLPLVAKSPNDLRLTLFGDGPMADLAAEYAAKYDNIEMCGLVPRRQVLEQMKGAHCTLSLRRVDNDYYKGFFPSKLIELLTSPAQCIVSDMGHITQMLGESVVLLTGLTDTQIMDALSKVRNTSQEQYYCILKRRQELLASTFNWSVLTKSIRNNGATEC